MNSVGSNSQAWNIKGYTIRLQTYEKRKFEFVAKEHWESSKNVKIHKFEVYEQRALKVDC